MKPHLDHHREFNPPAEMLARALCLAVFAGLALGGLLTIAGVVAWELRWSLTGLVIVGLAWGGRAWLQRSEDFAAAERSLREVFAGGPARDDEPAMRLLTLLERWEAMEAARGTAEFDPWELQELRNEIRAVVASDPELEALFTSLQRAV